ncbi:MAG: 3-methyl-2-oxobutanoate dehydrogenase subunit VorB [Spirochaetes bacterium GWF1_51_8]|nr:MAG: 3-methyl-2-oxobutanoate dehydrogenase subunit VorB [Spirochaetes bacterium GWF1_51_8]
MSKRVMMKGNIALAEGAVIAGCRFYFGYPITPQNEIPEYMSSRLPEIGGTFVQAESELASINMVLGAASTGARAMTTTSSPGFSLMQEGVSYLAACHLPCLLANVQRGGPGLGNINASQADYFQATKGGGHGDYHTIVLAPNSPQEMMDFAILGFELADKYRTPSLILSDGVIGLMMESVEVRDDYKPNFPSKPWALTGCKDRPKNVIRSLWLDQDGVPLNNDKLQAKYREIEKNEIRYEEYLTEDAEAVIIAYGLSSRISRDVIEHMRGEGHKVGLFRPITLYPFPYKRIAELAGKGVKKILTVEMSAGQMVEDVRLAVECKIQVEFYGELGGYFPSEAEIYKRMKALLK